MLGKQPFYHSLFLKYIIMFGSIFDQIEIQRFDKNKKLIQQIKVPITYAAKRKWVVMLSENQDKPVSQILPRISFFNTTITNDLSRKTSPLNQIVKISDKKDEMFRTYNAIPYKIHFDLYVVAKNHGDGMQIVEQIIPFFNQDFAPSLKLIPILDRTWKIPTRLVDLSCEDVYDGKFDQRQYIIWTLQFEVDAWFFGPVERQGVIKRIQLDFSIPPGDGPVTADDIATTGRSERVVVTPGLTVDGQQTSDPTQTIPYDDITSQDHYGYIEEITTYNDGEKYNPNIGKDVPIPNLPMANNSVDVPNPTLPLRVWKIIN